MPTQTLGPPQNERENTSYDVATLQDEEGELPDFPGELSPVPPQAPLPAWPLGSPGVSAHRPAERLEREGRSALASYSLFPGTPEV